MTPPPFGGRNDRHRASLRKCRLWVASTLIVAYLSKFVKCCFGGLTDCAGCGMIDFDKSKKRGERKMGMTDRQFISYRKQELEDYEDMLEIAKKTNANIELIKKLEKNVEKAKGDIEA
jgi:hypothetical protein